MNCTAVGLHSLPDSKSTLDNFTSILAHDNYLKHLNFTSLFKVFPQVVLMNLRDNNPPLCQDIVRFQPPKSIKITSYRKFSTTEIPTYSTSVIPAAHETKTLTYHSSSTASKLNISRNFSIHRSHHRNLKNGNLKSGNLVHLSADCNSDHSTNNSDFISINHSMLEIKTLTATAIGNA